MNPVTACSVEWCDREVYGLKEMCRLHYNRVRRTGDATPQKRRSGPPRTGSLNSSWKGDGVSYNGMHYRLSKQTRPTACEQCETTTGRFEWALRQGVPAERLRKSPEGYAYSLRVDDYANLCKPCHNRQDLRKGVCRAGLHDVTDRGSVYVDSTTGRRVCKACLNAKRRANRAAARQGGKS